MHTRLFSFLVLLLSMSGVVSFAASRVVSPDPNWTQHSSFDNLPRRIVDTSDAVYFFVHQRPYNTDSKYNYIYDIPTGAVFILDKTRKTSDGKIDFGQKLIDLHQKAPLSGTDVRYFTADPITGAMIFSYTDGGIDYIAPAPTPDAERPVRFLDNISVRNFPGASTVNSIAYDRQRRLFWVASNSGVLALDINDGSVVHETSWTDPVTDINSVGDDIIAIIDGKICSAPAASVTRRKAYTEIPGAPAFTRSSDSADSQPYRILPLGSDAFALVVAVLPSKNGDSMESGQTRIYLATRSGEGWNWSQWINDANIMFNPSTYYTVVDQFEHNFTPTPDGWLVISRSNSQYGTNLLHIPENPGEAPTKKWVTFPSDTSRFAASANGSDFWFYRERGLFLGATLEGSSFSDCTPEFRPEAPLTCMHMLFDYHPDQGLVAVNECGASESQTNGILRQPALVTVFRNGAWHNAAGAYHQPDLESFVSTWKSNRHRWPLADPNGLVIDPFFPDWIHMGSQFTGFSTFNVSEPSTYALNTIGSNQWLKNFPCSKDLVTAQAWAEASVNCCAGADADGNIWMYNTGSWTTTATSTIDFLKCLTYEGRKDAIEQNNPTLLQWKTLSYDSGHWCNTQAFARVFKHPRNRNKLLLSTQGEHSNFGRVATIYDTNGTIEDTSDDTVRMFSHVSTPQGASPYIAMLNGAIENPVTGEVLIFSGLGSWLINLDVDFETPNIPGKLITVKSPDGMSSEIIEPLQAHQACFDEYGRLWIGSSWAGVVGVDTASETLVAQYTTANSPLPSNAVYGIGWNPDTQSLFISTDLGMAEVRVDAPDNAAGGLQQPFIMPEHVPADFTGTVALRNVPDGLTVCVIDADGRRIVDLPAPTAGVTHWDLRDAEGHRLPAGLYRFIDPSRSSSFPTLNLTIAY